MVSTSYVSKYRSEPHRLPFSKDVANSIRSSHASYEERKKEEREVMKKRRQEEDRGEGEAELDDLLKKKKSSEALLQEGMSMLDEAMKMKDKGRAMTKAEAANARMPGKHLMMYKLPFQIVIPSARRKGRQICQGVSPTCSCLCSGHKSCNFIMLH